MREKLGPQGFKSERKQNPSIKGPKNILSGTSPQVCLPFGLYTTTSLLEKGNLLTDDWYVHEHHLETLGVMGGGIEAECEIFTRFPALHPIS